MRIHERRPDNERKVGKKGESSAQTNCDNFVLMRFRDMSEYENTSADLMQADSEGSGKKASEREKRESMDGEMLSCDSRHLAMTGNETESDGR